MNEAAERMFALLPAVFRRHGAGELERLLAALGWFFLDGAADGHGPGLESLVERIPALFDPLGNGDPESPFRTPDRFLPWLADWLAFTPHPLFPAERLRRILGGIVPLYGSRGTRDYLLRLLELCFGDELAAVHVDDRPRVGFTVGVSTLGVDTRLAVERPFFFRVGVVPGPAAGGHAALQKRVRAVIDFAKPAHTTYELEWRAAP